jgi:uncharacterized membrane protein
LVGFPLAGLIVGAVGVGVVAHLHDAGLTDALIRRAVHAIAPGGAVLLLLTDAADHLPLTTELARLGGVPLTPGAY